MDPLSALTVATSVVQFVSFASDVISKANEIRKNGSIADIEFLKQQTKSLNAVAQDSGLRDNNAYRAKPEDSEVHEIGEALSATVTRCTSAADDLLQLLEKVTASDQGTLRSVRQAFKIYWKKEKIESLSRKLDQCYLELNNHVLLLVNARCRSLGQIQAKILEVITFTRGYSEPADHGGPMSSQSKVSQDQLKSLDGQTSPRGTAHHRPVSVANIVVTLEDGRTESISLDSNSDPKFADFEIPQEHDEGIDTATTFRRDLRKPTTEAASIEPFTPLTRIILESLYFSALYAREDEIAEAHRQTFEWIFSHGEFTEFLKHEDGQFWVSGKAGSGKSTLMKFLHRHNQTMKALEQWADQKQLIVASFFFWNAGTSLQKSQEGLLRSILLEILQKHRSLIPVAFPGLCRTYLVTHDVDLTWLRFPELKSSLRRLLQEIGLRGFMTCLFIDGMDEYEGDHLELCKFFDELAGMPKLKVVLSSRPGNIFRAHFGESPSISMQDLTAKDIQRYITDYLKNDPEVRRLGSAAQAKMEQAGEKIADRAAGVFLWVTLVVRSLLHGLYNGDDLTDLQRRLDGVPTELDQYYRHMLQGLEPIYRKQAAKMFLIMLRSIRAGYEGVSILQLAYACEDTAATAIQAPRKPLSYEEQVAICQEMERRIRSRCCGLLENYQNSLEQQCTERAASSHIRFFHKSVVEFLESEKIQADLKSDLLEEHFDADAALLACALHEIKARSPERHMLWYSSNLHDAVGDCFRMAEWLEFTRAEPCIALLDELDLTMSSHWEAVDQWKTFELDNWSGEKSNGWPVLLADPIREILVDERLHQLDSTELAPFWIAAQMCGCWLYVAHKVIDNRMQGESLHMLLQDNIDRLFPLVRPGRVESQGMSPAGSIARAAVVSGRLIQKIFDINATFLFEVSYGRLFFMQPFTPELGRRQWRMECSIWEYFLTLLWFIALSSPSIERSIFSREEPEWYGVSTAFHCLQLCQEFLTAGATTESSFAGIYADLEHAREANHHLHQNLLKSEAVTQPRNVETCRDPEQREEGGEDCVQVKVPPQSVREILTNLYHAVCDPTKRTFLVNLQSDDLDLFQAEFTKTIQILREREVAQHPPPSQLQKFWKLPRSSAQSSKARLTLSFVLGGVIVALIARLLETP
ncbi:MAG: hypothetical protein M1822_004993 [Bathelium mastoideum]|nr:MAG: hypothetical protein M1822_004993 [Bathelium mastoideum]